MRALIIEHDPYTRPGLVGEALEARGFALERRLVVPADRFATPDVEHDFPSPLDYDLVIPMGAPWSVDDHGAIGSWILPELTMLRAAHEAGVPVLGICFGGQALAVALGGGVARATRWEIGWTVIRPVDEAAAEVVGAGPWFQFHQDAMLPPAGARSLADNAVCSQAWSLGRSLAVQFHPEVTVSVLDMWFANGGTHPVRANGLDPERVRDSLVEHEDAARDRTATLVNAYLDRVATHAR